MSVPAPPQNASCASRFGPAKHMVPLAPAPPVDGPSGAVAQRSVPAKDSVPAGDGVPADDSVPADERLRSVRTQFITRVSEAVLDQLLDQLLEREVLTDGERESMAVRARADKARDLMDTVRRKGPGACSELISALRNADRCLSGTLKLL
ncbi:caspase-1-like [Etheostoma cragini]|uniref:caspase-1-like n=1 Tax=Etheostoma cragini TaxID=417921 RepID=UPI00155ED288|nr:caspase-1-like [Etheostoma cragini]